MELYQCKTFDDLCDGPLGNETAIISVRNHDDDDIVEIGYLELRERTIDIASQLINRHGISKGDVVLIYIQDQFTPAQVSAMLACLRIGAIWLFHAYETVGVQSLADVVDRIAPKAAITIGENDNSENVKKLAENGIFRVVLLNDFDGDLVHSETIAAVSRWEYNETADNSDAMYLQFTSGSTGIPKVVVGSVSATTNRLSQDPVCIQYGEMCLRRTPSAFVDFVSETLGPLFNGATLVSSCKNSDILDLMHIARYQKVQRMLLIPSQLEIVCKYVQTPWEELRTIVVSGEPLRKHAVTEFQKWICGRSVHLFSLYGSSEITGDVCCVSLHDRILKDLFDCEYELQGAVPAPIGRPFSNCVVQVQPEDSLEDNALEPGLVGELVVKGDCLAMGYWPLPANSIPIMSDTKFAVVNGNRVFRTGDLGFCDHNGEFYWTGRVDNQRKLRGIRVDLDAVDACIGNVVHSQVVSVVVRDKWLVVFSQDTFANLDTSAVPHLYYPHRIVPIDAFPKTPSGKIDRKQLEHQAGLLKFPEDGSSDATTIMELVVSVLPSFESHQYSFVQNGGDSMLAVELSFLLKSKFQISVSTESLLSDTSLAMLLGMDSKKRTRNEENNPIPASKLQRRKQFHLDAILWDREMSACVDAQALVIDTFVYCASHAADLVKLNVNDGSTVWKTLLPGRVQSQACINKSKNLLYVSCFVASDIHGTVDSDERAPGALVVVETSTGDIVQKFEHAAAIKCTPTLTFDDQQVWVGTYDAMILVYQLQQGTVRKINATGDFHASILRVEPSWMVAASNSGHVSGYDASKTSDLPVWTLQVGPVFGNMASVGDSLVLIPSVDLCIHAFDLRSMNVVWTVDGTRPIFSSVEVYANIWGVFGCHDCFARCVSTSTGDKRWEVKLDSAIVAKPCVLSDTRCVVATTSGSLYTLDMETGAILRQVSLPAEIYSGPAQASLTSFIIGCRDNYVRKIVI